MQWEISPFIGIGPLSFGMTISDVSQLNHMIGQVTDTHTAFDGSINEYRGINSPVCNYFNGKLRTVDTDRHCKNILYKNIDVYNAQPIEILRSLQKENGGAKGGLGSVLFENIGVNTGGFYIFNKKGGGYIYNFKNHDQDERSLSVFAKGTFDPLIDKFQPIQL